MLRYAFMPLYDADYYRARAMEHRGLAEEAAKADVAAFHLELARQLDGLAKQHDGLADQFDALVERASHLLSEGKR